MKPASREALRSLGIGLLATIVTPGCLAVAAVSSLGVAVFVAGTGLAILPIRRGAWRDPLITSPRRGDHPGVDVPGARP